MEKLWKGIPSEHLNTRKRVGKFFNFLDRFVAGSTTINYVECYDADANEWFDAAPMNLNRSALSACVIRGLSNAREYSYVGRSQKEVGQGAGTLLNEMTNDVH